MKKQSGQALLIAVLILSVLAIAIPAIIYLNMTGALHHAATTNRDKAVGIAEEGVGYAKGLLSTPANWTAALGTVFPDGPAPGNDGCNTTQDIVGADGGHFRLYCGSLAADATFPCPHDAANVSKCKPYQVYMKATAYLQSPQGTTAMADNVTPDPSRSVPFAPFRAIEAYLSQQTLAAVLPSGLVAPAAFEMLQTPTFPAGGGAYLWMYNGPVVVHDNAAWTLDPDSDQCRQPRKFSKGPIQGCAAGAGAGCPFFPRAPVATPPTSDNKEYWAYTDVGFPPVINIDPLDPNSYYTASLNTNNVPQPKCNSSGGALIPYSVNCNPVTPNCGYFDATTCGGANTAFFDGAGSVSPPNNTGAKGYFFAAATNITPNAVIYVKGNAEFDHVTIDVSNRGAIVVEGNLKLGNNGDGVAPPSYVGMNLTSVPSTCALDSPYPNTACAPVCTTAMTGYIDLKGLLYVKGNLVMDTTPNVNPNPGHWVIDGLVRVDGSTTMNNGVLEIAFNDIANRFVRLPAANFQLLVDNQTEIPVK